MSDHDSTQNLRELLNEYERQFKEFIFFCEDIDVIDSKLGVYWFSIK